jgi:hypothetical protein
MLWLDITEDGKFICCLIALLTPTLNSPFSPLIKQRFFLGEKQKAFIKNFYYKKYFYLRKMNASPATKRFELTNTLQPLCNRCLLGCPKFVTTNLYLVYYKLNFSHIMI